MPKTGDEILRLGRKHVGETYRLGILAPKNNPQWKGPWDCAEFASWLVFQSAQILYGCSKNSGDPASADAYTGFWSRDVSSLGRAVSVDDAARTPGACVLRIPQPGAMGHIVISDGRGGTVEAHSTARGVITSTLSGRRWDTGVLVPGFAYKTGTVPIDVTPPSTAILLLTDPHMKGSAVLAVQRALKAAGFSPGPLDGDFGPMTHAAVVAFQASHGLVADGEVGPITAKALGIAASRQGDGASTGGRRRISRKVGGGQHSRRSAVRRRSRR